MDGRPRRFTRSVLLGVTVLSFGCAFAIVVTGGFTWATVPFRMTARDAFRPIVVCALSIVTLGYVDPDFFSHCVDAVGRALAGKYQVCAFSVAALIAFVGFTNATYTACGSDSYGYVSQAALWSKGELSVDQNWLQPLSFPIDDWALSPLGYRPGIKPHTIVPIYSPGLPLLMAGA